MPDQGNSRRNLSEISHLFLSSVREKQMGGAAAPRRKPPTARVSLELSPEEYRQVLGDAPGREPMRVPPVKAVIASHLGHRQLECVRRYARHVAGQGQHVGLMVLDAGEFRLIRFDPQCSEESVEALESRCFDARAMTDAINELNCDLDCWLVAVANPRLAEARAVLAQVRSWVALGTCDQEGVVGSYRSMKGLSDLLAGVERVSFAAVDVSDAQEADGVYRKLAGVCEQFLNQQLESEGAVQEAGDVGEAGVMSCVVEHDKAQLAGAAHWQVVGEFLETAKRCPTEVSVVESQVKEADAVNRGPMTLVQEPAGAREEHDGAEKVQAVMLAGQRDYGRNSGTDEAEVIELPAGADGPENVLAAVMKQATGAMVECPVRPPMCPEARLAVSRDKRLVLVAVAKSGLADLKAIGQAYRWMVENRGLLAMALPQFALDGDQMPHLRLLVDQADVNAEMLQPVFAAETVQVQTYRRVKWGQLRGLLLEAA